MAWCWGSDRGVARRRPSSQQQKLLWPGYGADSGIMRPLIIPFFIPHVGCPHTCLFCNQHQISGVEQQLPSAQQITDTILQWLERTPRRTAEVAFYGGSFTLLPRKQQEQLL